MTSSIGAIVRDGIAFDPKRRGNLNGIRSTTESLLDELERARVPYVLVGGVNVVFAESSRSEMRNRVEHFALGAGKKVGFWPTF